MKSDLSKYKNIDKSTQLLFDEKETFKILHFNNLSHQNTFLKYYLENNCIQLFFCNKGEYIASFNFEHCAINISENNSNMVYFKDEKMNILFNLQPKSEATIVLISIEYFHSLFSNEGNFLFNFSNFKVGKPIIEPRTLNPSIKIILNQLISKQISEALRPIYIKGKVYELLSYYFNTTTEEDSNTCPYISNEETISQIKHAKQLIIKEMNNPPSLNDLAKEVGLNIKKLKTGFKEFYGVPVYAFLLNYKMELAKKLLIEKQLNVNEIALQLGYSASSHFIAAFKKKYGITPKQFSKSQIL